MQTARESHPGPFFFARTARYAGAFGKHAIGIDVIAVPHSKSESCFESSAIDSTCPSANRVTSLSPGLT